HHEEAVALDRQVGGTAGQLGGALGVVVDDPGDGHTETDLGRVGATRTGGAPVGDPRSPDGLAQQVLEHGGGRLVAHRVDVGDVIADHVHHRLVAAEAGDPR